MPTTAPSRTERRIRSGARCGELQRRSASRSLRSRKGKKKPRVRTEAGTRAPKAIGLLYVPANADDEFIAGEESGYDRLAQRGGLVLTRVVPNRESVVSDVPFENRKAIIEVIQ